MEKKKLLGILLYLEIIFAIDIWLWTSLQVNEYNIYGFIGMNIIGVFLHLIAVDIFLCIKLLKEKKNKSISK